MHVTSLAVHYSFACWSAPNYPDLLADLDPQVHSRLLLGQIWGSCSPIVTHAFYGPIYWKENFEILQFQCNSTLKLMNVLMIDYDEFYVLCFMLRNCCCFIHFICIDIKMMKNDKFLWFMWLIFWHYCSLTVH